MDSAPKGTGRGTARPARRPRRPARGAGAGARGAHGKTEPHPEAAAAAAGDVPRGHSWDLEPLVGLPERRPRSQPGPAGSRTRPKPDSRADPAGARRPRLRPAAALLSRQNQVASQASPLRSAIREEVSLTPLATARGTNQEPARRGAAGEAAPDPGARAARLEVGGRNPRPPGRPPPAPAGPLFVPRRPDRFRPHTRALRDAGPWTGCGRRARARRPGTGPEGRQPAAGEPGERPAGPFSPPRAGCPWRGGRDRRAAPRTPLTPAAPGAAARPAGTRARRRLPLCRPRVRADAPGVGALSAHLTLGTACLLFPGERTLTARGAARRPHVHVPGAAGRGGRRRPRRARAAGRPNFAGGAANFGGGRGCGARP